ATHRDGLHALLRRIVEVKDFPTETLLNINLPAIPGDQVKGVKVTHLGSRVFSEEIALMKDPWGKDIYWIGGGRITWTGDADSDFRATSDGYISVTPLHLDMTNYDLLEVVHKWFRETEPRGERGRRHLWRVPCPVGRNAPGTRHPRSRGAQGIRRDSAASVRSRSGAPPGVRGCRAPHRQRPDHFTAVHAGAVSRGTATDREGESARDRHRIGVPDRAAGRARRHGLLGGTGRDAGARRPAGAAPGGCDERVGAARRRDAGVERLRALRR